MLRRIAVQEKLLVLWTCLLSASIAVSYHYTGHSQYYLIWNLFLAYVPLWCSCRLVNAKNRLWRGLLYVVWLFFYPNALYIVTDLIHLQNSTFYTVSPTDSVYYVMNEGIWLRMFTLFVAVLIGVLMGCHSYQLIRQEWQKYHRDSRIVKMLVLMLISLVNGVAIVIGRFGRLNSWDIVTNVRAVVDTALLPFSQPYLTYTILFSVLHLIVIVGYIQWHQPRRA